MSMLMWLSMEPISHVLLIDVPTQGSVSLFTEENRIKQASQGYLQSSEPEKIYFFLLHCHSF